MVDAVWGFFSVYIIVFGVMMIAMMLPSAAPMILLFATVNRRQRALNAPYVPTSVFASGYLAAWAGFTSAADMPK